MEATNQYHAFATWKNLIIVISSSGCMVLLRRDQRFFAFYIAISDYKLQYFMHFSLPMHTFCTCFHSHVQPRNRSVKGELNQRVFQFAEKK